MVTFSSDFSTINEKEFNLGLNVQGKAVVYDDNLRRYSAVATGTLVNN